MHLNECKKEMRFNIKKIFSLFTKASIAFKGNIWLSRDRSSHLFEIKEF